MSDSSKSKYLAEGYKLFLGLGTGFCLALLVNHLPREMIAQSQEKGSEQLRAEQILQMTQISNRLEKEKAAAYEELAGLRSKYKDLELALLKGEDQQQSLRTIAQDSRMRSGLSSVEGPGVEIRMADAPTPSEENPAQDPYFFIVHDVDIQSLVNELWASGAEAISVNGQRIVVRSSIRCVGPTVLVNNVRLASPYTIKAIGPADAIIGGLNMPGGFVDSMNPLLGNGGTIRITPRDDVLIEEFSGSLEYQYAKPTSDKRKASR